jgi:hypothetical protein
MDMQRQSSEYRASLILAAASGGTPPTPGQVSESRDSGAGRHIGYRDVEDIDPDHCEVLYRDLSGLDDDDQPTYWYWSYDHPDAGI